VLLYFSFECAKVFSGLSYAKTINGGSLLESLSQLMGVCSVGIFCLLIFAAQRWFPHTTEIRAGGLSDHKSLRL
jgi:hypothetical protein